MASPYERILGDELDNLHPRLRAYFGAIPEGSVGRGQGTFDVVGTPRRWLWPALRILSFQGIAFPVWAANVPFDVENRPVVDAAGNTAVAAVRTFHFGERHGGTRTMVDAITAEPAGLVDHLGPSRLLGAELSATVRDGSLRLDSRGLTIRVGRRRMALPRALAPRVALTERFDDDVDRQHVTVILSLPLVGRVYEYSGHFDYAITLEEAP